MGWNRNINTVFGLIPKPNYPQSSFKILLAVYMDKARKECILVN